MSSECNWESLISDARRACSSVERWPGKENVVWLMPQEVRRRWEVAVGVQPVGKIKDKVHSDTQLLNDLKEKILWQAYTHFNACQSIPKFDSNANDRVKWPGNVSRVRNVWIAPTCSLNDAISMVIKEVEDLWRDETVILHGFPLSSTFAVHVLFVISHMFEKAGFMYPVDLHTTIIFFEFNNVPSCIDLLRQVRSALKDPLKDLVNLSITPNSEFQESKFLRISKILNCNLIKEEILDIVKNMETSCEEADALLEDLQGQCQSLDCLSKQHSRCSLFCTRMHEQLNHLSFYIQRIQVFENEMAFSWQDPIEKGCPSIEVVKRTTESTDLSKFCLKQLLHCHGRICQILKYSLELTEEEIREKSCLSHDYNTTTSMKKYPWSDSALEVNILDFGNELWLNKNNANQPEILRRIVIILEDMWAGECLELRGFPLLSEFNVGVVYLIAHLFQKIRFFHSHRGRNSIFFSNYQSAPANLTKHLGKILLRENCNSLQSIVELKKIHSPDFYVKVSSFNNVVLKEQSLYMLKTLTGEVDAVCAVK